MSTPFIVFAAPRSRTAWTSRFLSPQSWHCGHEQLRYARTLDDVRAWLGTPKFASAETTGMGFWRLAKRLRPDLRFVTIRRPQEETLDSLARLGFDREALRGPIFRANAKLDQIEHRVEHCTRVEFASLSTEAGLRQLWLGAFGPDGPAFDFPRAQALCPVDIQIDLSPLFRYFIANRKGLEALEREGKGAELSALVPRRDQSGLTIEVEPFDRLLTEGQRSFVVHSLLCGEAADSWGEKNHELYRELEARGNLKVCVARKNGTPAGYLFLILSPSLNSRSRATNGPFFAHPKFAGLGLKLQRFALEVAKRAGADELWWQEGEKGARISALARRLGALPAGTLLRKDLN